MRRRVLFAVLLAILACIGPALGPAGAQKGSAVDHPTPDKTLLSVDQTLADVAPMVRAKIDPLLLKELQGHSAGADPSPASMGASARPSSAPAAMTTFLVYLREDALSRPTVARELEAAHDVVARRRLLVQRLRETAEASQEPVRRLLEQQRAEGHVSGYRSYWVFNGLAVDGDLNAALALAARDDVQAVRRNRVHRLPAPLGRSGTSMASIVASEPSWNIAHVGADRVWDELQITGRGIVVANMDSGVDWTHPALRTHYRGYNPKNPAVSDHDYSWFDATGTYPDAPGPNEANLSAWSDHGTHTMGTLVGGEPDGSHAIGMAPGAAWIALKLFDNGGNSTDEWLHAGFQWCLAPTRLDGSDPDPAMAPHIVSNSWGDDNALDVSFRADLAAWREAGIYSTWAGGNAGPSQRTMNSPASYPEAVGVGAVDSANRVASFSSRGSSPWGDMPKPDIVAPGVSVYSAIAGGGYEYWNGTSMATPHVAGLAALMWEAAGAPGEAGARLAGRPTVDETTVIITSTATDLGVFGPDMETGYGVIDARQAVGALFEGGALVGRITDTESGEGIVGAIVRLQNRFTGDQIQAVTASGGAYEASVMAGRYDVTIEAFGYTPGVAQDIEIAAHMQTQLDLALMPLPRATLQGQVRVQDGSPPPAVIITLLGTPLAATVGPGGAYSLDVPVGTYTLRVLADEPGYRGALVEGLALVAGETRVVDLELRRIPRLLLVEADAYSAEHDAAPYVAALDALLYSFDRHRILDLPADVPSIPQLAAYDVVIWAQTVTSPGYVTAWEELGGYLDAGGRVLISGQDIGFWDVQEGMAGEAYRRYLHALYLRNAGGMTPAQGLAGTPFEGLTVELNTADSAGNQTDPDVIASADGLSDPILANEDGNVVGLATRCCGHRVVYLSVGLEGVGPLATRAELIDRSLTLLMDDTPPDGLKLFFPLQYQAAIAGTVVLYPLAVVNTGAAARAFALSTDSAWPVEVIDPLTLAPIESPSVLAPCARVELGLRVVVPRDAQMTAPNACAVAVVDLDASAVSDEVDVRTVAFEPWRSGASPPGGRYRHSVVEMACTLFSIGGFDEDHEATATVDRYDLSSGVWRGATPRPHVAANSAAVAVGGKVYALGGYNPELASPYLAAVDVYDPEADVWSAGPALPKALAGHAAVALDGAIYCFGGRGEAGLLNGGYVLDPGATSWREVSGPPDGGVEFAALAALGDELYLVGGWPARESCYRYDVASDVWDAVPPLQRGRHSFALGSDGRYLYAAGGGVGWDATGSVERYDPAHREWLTLPPLDDGERLGAAGALAQGQLYVLGGADAGDTTALEVLSVGGAGYGSALTLEPAVVQPGEPLGYTLTVRNPDPEARLCRWSHTLPVDLTLLPESLPESVQYDGWTRRLYWQGHLDAQGERAFRFTVLAPSEPLHLRQVITASVGLDLGLCAPLTVTARALVAAPGLDASTKTVNRDAALPGDALRYEIIVRNASPFPAASVRVTDALPAGASYVPGSVSGGEASGDGARVTWQGALPAEPSFGAELTWYDATVGRDLRLGDDECSGPIDLGFTFWFDGQPYSSVYVNSNGQVLLEACSSRYTNAPIPAALGPDAFIAPLWDDLTPDPDDPQGGRVYMATLGVAPQRVAVIEWRHVPAFGRDGDNTFELVLHEGSNRILCQYLELSGGRGHGASATVGWESADGLRGVQYLFDGQPAQNRLADRSAVELVQPSTVPPTSHRLTFAARVDDVFPPTPYGETRAITNVVRIDSGRQVIEREAVTHVGGSSFTRSQMSAAAEVMAGGMLTYTLLLWNDGALDAEALRLENVLPPAVEIVPDSLVGPGLWYDTAARVVRWEGRLAATSAITDALRLRYAVRVDGGLGANTALTNTATLYQREVLVHWLATQTCVNPVVLKVSKEADRAEVYPGESINYALTVSNNGSYTATGVVLTDVVPLALDIGAISPPGLGHAADPQLVGWSGDLAPGASVRVSYTAYPNATAINGQVIENRMQVLDGAGNTYSAVAAVVVRRADLSGSALVVSPDAVRAGQWVTVTAQVCNEGAATAQATLRLPCEDGLAIVHGTPFATSGDVGLEDGVLVWRGAVAPRTLALVRVQLATGATTAGAYRLSALLCDDGGAPIELADTIYVDAAAREFLPLVLKEGGG